MFLLEETTTYLNVLFKGGGCWSNFRGNIFLLNFELLTFLCRQMIKLSIHICHDSKINQFIYRKRISCVMLALFV